MSMICRFTDTLATEDATVQNLKGKGWSGSFVVHRVFIDWCRGIK